MLVAASQRVSALSIAKTSPNGQSQGPMGKNQGTQILLTTPGNLIEQNLTPISQSPDKLGFVAKATGQDLQMPGPGEQIQFMHSHVRTPASQELQSRESKQKSPTLRNYARKKRDQNVQGQALRLPNPSVRLLSKAKANQNRQS